MPINRKSVVLFEGPDFSGKTTLINKVQDYLTNKNENNRIIREPDSYFKELFVSDSKIDSVFNIDPEIHNYWSGTEVQKLRSLARYNLAMTARCSTYIDVCNTIKGGTTVLLDRSFLSTMIYQKDVRSDILAENIKLISSITEQLLDSGDKNLFIPDLIIFLDISVETYINRMNGGRNVNDLDQQEVTKINELLGDYRYVYSTLKISNHYGSRVVKIQNDDRPDNFEYVCDMVHGFINEF